MSPSERVAELHANGVHVECKRVGKTSPAFCERPGRVDRFHSHDYDGPLVCGCSEFGDD